MLNNKKETNEIDKNTIAYNFEIQGFIKYGGIYNGKGRYNCL